MPVLHSAIHKIDKKPDGTPAVLFLGGAEQVESQARDDLMHQFNESYNGTTAHHERLRKQRDKLAPAVRTEAAKGVVASVAAKNLGMHIKRVTLIAQENGFKFADSP